MDIEVFRVTTIMFSLLFLRDLGHFTNTIQLQRLNKSNDTFCSDSENVLEKITMKLNKTFNISVNN